MAESARRVLAIARRSLSNSFDDLSRYSARHYERLAHRIRLIVWGGDTVDEASASLLRAYRLRNTVWDKEAVPDGGFRRMPIGVVIGGDDFAGFHKGLHISRKSRDRFPGTRAADSSYLGYFLVRVPHGVKVSDLVRWRIGEPLWPEAEWIPLPFGPAALEGRPPVRIAAHNGADGFVTEIMKKPRQAPFGRTLKDRAYRRVFVNAGDLVELLQQNTYLQDALKAHPTSAIWFSACGTTVDQGRVIASGLGRDTYISTGVSETFSSHLLNVAVPGNPFVPFSLTDQALQHFHSTLDRAPENLGKVGQKFGWSATAIYVEADSLVPPIQMVTRTPATAGGGPARFGGQ